MIEHRDEERWLLASQDLLSPQPRGDRLVQLMVRELTRAGIESPRIALGLRAALEAAARGTTQQQADIAADPSMITSIIRRSSRCDAGA
ncbi:hypothetical protein [Micromonospora sp. bgisy143]|uniref:hypothetical protein n=1 Tax=Micromonospora sp. bgisy143 TaxID=3413790 RepID=UPI003EB9AFD7